MKQIQIERTTQKHPLRHGLTLGLALISAVGCQSMLKTRSAKEGPKDQFSCGEHIPQSGGHIPASAVQGTTDKRAYSQQIPPYGQQILAQGSNSVQRR